MILEIRRKSQPNLALLAVEIDDALVLQMLAFTIDGGARDISDVAPHIIAAGCRALDKLSNEELETLLTEPPK